MLSSAWSLFPSGCSGAALLAPLLWGGVGKKACSLQPGSKCVRGGGGGSSLPRELPSWAWGECWLWSWGGWAGAKPSGLFCLTGWGVLSFAGHD